MITQKRKSPASADTESPRPLKITRLSQKARNGNRPIVTMLLEYGVSQKIPIHVLLDSGCTAPLISTKLVDKLGIRCYHHEEQLPIRGFDGTEVQGAGQNFTPPLNLQHRSHHSKEVFEVAPLDPAADILLPFWWITEHPPQGAWDSSELRFGSPRCLKHCTKTAVQEFSLDLDDNIMFDPQASLIGHISAASSEEDPLAQVPRSSGSSLGSWYPRLQTPSRNTRFMTTQSTSRKARSRHGAPLTHSQKCNSPPSETGSRTCFAQEKSSARHLPPARLSFSCQNLKTADYASASTTEESTALQSITDTHSRSWTYSKFAHKAPIKTVTIWYACAKETSGKPPFGLAMDFTSSWLCRSD